MSSFLDNPPLIDPRNEDQLTQQAMRYAFEKSGGLLNDFSDGNPLSVLLRTQSYVSAELLFYVSLLPTALAVKFLEITGTVRSLGTKALSRVRFTLVTSRTGVFTVPSGFIVQGSANGQTLLYSLIDRLDFQPGQTEMTGIVEAAAAGTAYNIPAGFINQIITPLSFLNSIVNIDAAQGGSDLETEDSAIARALKVIRSPAWVSQDDFQYHTEELLGIGSTCKAIGLLNGDRTAYIPGNVHLFLRDNLGNSATDTQIATVASAMSSAKPMGVSVHISPMPFVNVNVDVIATIAESADPRSVADSMWNELGLYINPNSWEPGFSILLSEVQFQLRLADGVQSIDNLLLNDTGLNVSMPNAWTYAKVYSLSMTLVNGTTGVIFRILLGQGDPPL
jgi:uncharacterized phage protein gp47/JayE